MPCDHKKIKFLPVKCADRFPGVFVCEECQEKFNFDPSGKHTVRYLNQPNPRIQWKTLDIKG